jgi:hypothetical protein
MVAPLHGFGIVTDASVDHLPLEHDLDDYGLTMTYLYLTKSSVVTHSRERRWELAGGRDGHVVMDLGWLFSAPPSRHPLIYILAEDSGVVSWSNLTPNPTYRQLERLW